MPEKFKNIENNNEELGDISRNDLILKQLTK
jgi:hypothetical protein